jgi:hypothetical protein
MGRLGHAEMCRNADRLLADLTLECERSTAFVAQLRYERARMIRLAELFQAAAFEAGRKQLRSNSAATKKSPNPL